MDIVHQVEQLLEQKKIDIFIGYREIDGHVIPHGFTLENLEELKSLKLGDQRYALEKMAAGLARRDKALKIGIIARDCNNRALNTLFTWNQLDPDKVETITVNCCPSPITPHAECSLLSPKSTGIYKRENGIAFDSDPETFKKDHDNSDRFSRWMYEFSKCIKCYGCRNVCPVCFCSECSLENDELVESGNLPPDVPIFHLIRASHMAGRCIDCGLCEEACPSDIPLRFLHREMNRIVSSVFDYQPGQGQTKSPFTILGDKVTLTPQPMDMDMETEENRE